MKRSHQTIQTPSFLDLTQESRTNKAVLPLDTGVKLQYDKENDSHFVLDTESRSTIMPHSSSDVGSGVGMTKMECGRSLVEMLGVLAVIGVLSVGAIAGYRRAMDSQRASATIAELNQYAFLASQQALQKRADLDLSELGNVTNQGYPVSAVVQADPTFFEIFLKDVPASICERILDSDWSVPLVMFANNYAYTGETGICDNGEDELADMAFQFKEDLNPDAMPMGGCVQDSDCKGGCVKCENQQCVSTCVGSERCATDQETGEKVCCPSEKRAGPMCCSSTQNGWCCNTSGQCCPWHKPLVDKNGKCYSCDTEAGVDVTGVTENCSACSNREVVNDKSCVLKCPKEKPLRATDGKCYACNEVISINTGTDEVKCTGICPNRIMLNSYCALGCSEGEFMNKAANCLSCSTLTPAVPLSQAECNKCPNRSYYSGIKNSFCVIDCPAGEFRGGDGECYSCSESSPISMGLTQNAYNYWSEGYCSSVCPNRVGNGFWHINCSLDCADGYFTATDGSCHSCNEEANINVDSVQTKGCDQCTNRSLYHTTCIKDCPTGQIRGGDGLCYDCNQEEPIYMNFRYMEKYCETACSNRVGTGDYRTYCSLPCNNNNFTNSKGVCISCDYEKNVDLGGARLSYDCSNCPDTRNQYNNMCVPKCPAETPLRGYDNKCYACDDPARINVSAMTDACYECPDERKLDGNYCVLK